jgi:flagellar hook-associated protein 1
MSLFSTIQKGSNALQVAELGLKVVGNNVANATTPGYIRQELIQTSGPSLKLGSLIFGQGVKAVGVVQKMDQFVIDRMRQVRSDLESSDRVSQLYADFENILGEMTQIDLSSKMNDFSASIQDLLNQPGNEALRRLVIERGHVLTGEIRTIDQQLDSFTNLLNSETRQMVKEINRLTEDIAGLNRQIVELEGGEASRTSDAASLRDQRKRALDELSGYVNLRAVEQASGAVSVFVGGEYLVADGLQRPVREALNTQAENTFPEVRLADTDFPLEVTGGRLHGIYTARTMVVQGLRDSLDGFSRDVIEQFNQIHTQGQGAVGFREITSHNATDDPQGALDLAGYSSSINNGEFQVQVTDLETGRVTTRVIRVQLTGAIDDTSLQDIQSQLNAISGISAEITADGRLNLATTSHRLRFSFQQDTSNFLAAAGINTFFVGDSAASIRVNPVVAEDPRLFAASLNGVGYGTENAVKLAQAFDDPIAALGNRSLKDSYEDMVVRVFQEVNLQKGKSDGLRNFYQTLEAQHLAASGVNMDEEAIKMIFYQRVFQANSKLIQTSSEMLEILVNL